MLKKLFDLLKNLVTGKQSPSVREGFLKKLKAIKKEKK